MMLVRVFAGLGLLLAALGIYGVISYSVTRQTQEIGIRMALGESAARVRKRVLKEHAAAGRGGSGGWARPFRLRRRGWWRRCCMRLRRGTAVTYVGMAEALLAVAALAGYVPAVRASRVSPLVALRSE